jgi:hypothetical protein
VSTLRRLLWWLHNQYAIGTIVGDVTAVDGRVHLSFLPHFEASLTPESAEIIIEALTYQTRVARGEAPPRRIDYREDR